MQRSVAVLDGQAKEQSIEYVDPEAYLKGQMSTLNSNNTSFKETTLLGEENDIESEEDRSTFKKELDKDRINGS